MNIVNFLDERWLISLLDNLEVDTNGILDYLDYIDEIKSTCGRETISYPIDLLEKECKHGLICDILWGELSRNEDYRDIIQRISRLINEAENIPITHNECINYESSALNALHANKHGGLIYDKEEVLEWWDSLSMILISDKHKLKSLYRCLSIYHKLSYDDFSQHLEKAFPNLYFLSGAEDFAKADIAEKHDNRLALFIQHLSYLNDFARTDFLQSPQDLEAKARQYGIDLSRESTNTKGNQAAIRERTKKIAGQDIFFELHTKLRREKGRIHFHIGSNLSESVLAVTGDRLIIGIVCKHLIT